MMNKSSPSNAYRTRAKAKTVAATAGGPETAHQFVNDGDQDLRILTIGEHRGDQVEYPAPPWQGGDPFPTV